MLSKFFEFALTNKSKKKSERYVDGLVTKILDKKAKKLKANVPNSYQDPIESFESKPALLLQEKPSTVVGGAAAEANHQSFVGRGAESKVNAEPTPGFQSKNLAESGPGPEPVGPVDRGKSKVYPNLAVARLRSPNGINYPKFYKNIKHQIKASILARQKYKAQIDNTLGTQFAQTSDLKRVHDFLSNLSKGEIKLLKNLVNVKPKK